MWTTLIAILVVSALVGLSIYSIVADRKKGRSSCGGSCASCGVCHMKEAGRCPGAKSN